MAGNNIVVLIFMFAFSDVEMVVRDAQGGVSVYNVETNKHRVLLTSSSFVSIRYQFIDLISTAKQIAIGLYHNCVSEFSIHFSFKEKIKKYIYYIYIYKIITNYVRLTEQCYEDRILEILLLEWN